MFKTTVWGYKKLLKHIILTTERFLFLDFFFTNVRLFFLLVLIDVLDTIIGYMKMANYIKRKMCKVVVVCGM